ncbi:endonuclease/exonuclease/phosphatase family protein [Hydrogenophaga sp. BPS33]|uniref:endonuclease/exonuclease/phosphatase family protein n=1 Tax=Hydrogenophaga sp. BPS33 TaxID=2651974 RepID=UPI00132012BD|nr:endonuclease/exonuclease/phosphatase family protein [Hydrogenophaga sp. BPS33]QHE87264.1 EEP domain-containing protein [Hydrogenophaga sp. BPS33]
MQVLTVNIHKGYDVFNTRYVLHGLREAVREVGSDIVFLQEVDGGTSATAAQYEFLADQIWPQHAYGRNAVAEGLNHGNAILSRYPVLHNENHDLSIPGFEPRGMLHCVLDVPGHGPEMHVMCAHLGLRESHRRQQLEKICDIVGKHVPDGAPLVVAGDFNDWRLKADGLLAPSGLNEVFRLAHGQHARSFPSRWPLLRLDRIYVRDVAYAAPVPLARQPWDRLSDHAPLAADIALEAAA